MELGGVLVPTYRNRVVIFYLFVDINDSSDWLRLAQTGSAGVGAWAEYGKILGLMLSV